MPRSCFWTPSRWNVFGFSCFVAISDLASSESPFAAAVVAAALAVIVAIVVVGVFVVDAAVAAAGAAAAAAWIFGLWSQNATKTKPTPLSDEKQNNGPLF